MAKTKLTDLDVSDCEFTNSGQLWVSNATETNWTVTKDLVFTDDKGRDLKLGELIDRLEAIEKRLAIIPEPTEEELEKHKALRQAYNKYKFIEGLIGEDGDDSR